MVIFFARYPCIGSIQLHILGPKLASPVFRQMAVLRFYLCEIKASMDDLNIRALKYYERGLSEG